MWGQGLRGVGVEVGVVVEGGPGGDVEAVLEGPVRREGVLELGVAGEADVANVDDAVAFEGGEGAVGGVALVRGPGEEEGVAFGVGEDGGFGFEGLDLVVVVGAGAVGVGGDDVEAFGGEEARPEAGAGADFEEPAGADEAGDGRDGVTVGDGPAVVGDEAAAAVRLGAGALEPFVEVDAGRGVTTEVGVVEG